MAQRATESVDGQEDQDRPKVPYENSRTIDNFIITKAFERGAAFSTDKAAVFGMLTQVLQSVRTQSRSIADRLDDNMALIQGIDNSGEENSLNLDNLQNADSSTPGITNKEVKLKRDKQGNTI